MKIFPRQTIFFSVSLSVKTFFFRCHLPAFFHACKKFSWAFFAFANKFFMISFMISFIQFVALAAISKSVESTRDTFKSRFAFCYLFGAKKRGKQVKF